MQRTRGYEPDDLVARCQDGHERLVLVTDQRPDDRRLGSIKKAARLSDRTLVTVTMDELVRWCAGRGPALMMSAVSGATDVRDIPVERRSLEALSAELLTHVQRAAEERPLLFAIEHAQHLDATTWAVLRRVVTTAGSGVDIVIAAVLSGPVPGVLLNASPANAGISARADAAVARGAGDTVSALEHLEVSLQQHIAGGWQLEAVRDCEAALALPGPTSSRLDLLRVRAELATEIAHPRTLEWWRDLARAADRAQRNDLLACAWFQLYWCEDDGEDVERLRRAAALPDARGWADRARACLEGLAGNYAVAAAFDSAALEQAQLHGDWRLEMLALDKQAVARACMGESSTPVDMLRRSLEIGERHQQHSVCVPGWLTLSDMHADQAQPLQQLEAARHAVRIAEAAGLHEWHAVARSYESYALANAGELRAARAIAESAASTVAATAPSQRSAALVRQLSHVLLEMGDLPAATRALTRLEREVEQAGVASFALEVAWDQARVAALRGDFEAAVTLVRSLGAAEPTLSAAAALALLRTAVQHDCAHAVEAAVELLATLDSDGSALVVLAQDEAAVTNAALATGDLAGLRAIAAEWEDRGRMLDAARVQATLGFLQQRTTGDATELQHAHDLLTACGADAEADFVRAATGRAGRHRGDSPTGLTRREVQVVRCIGDGMSTAEICDQLHVRPSNVRRILTNLYRKTGTRSRVELARWADDQRGLVDVSSYSVFSS